MGLKICKPDTHTNRAVAVGAVSFYVDHFVTGRISKFTYGTLGNARYQPSNPEHVMREHKSWVDPAGNKWVPNRFNTMLPRGTKVMEDREVRLGLCYVSKTNTPQRQVFQSVFKYTGAGNVPEWMDKERDKFETLCSIQADVSTAPYRTKRGKTGATCFAREFEVILFIGLTELKAQIGWMDSVTGAEKRSDAVVAYDNPSDWT